MAGTAVPTPARAGGRAKDILAATRTVTLRAPLRRAIARLLKGYDFVIAVTPAGIDVLILPQSSASDAGRPPPAPAALPQPAASRERD